MSANALRLPLVAISAMLLTGSLAMAANDAGPEPYHAADPVYAPMHQEPLVKPMTADHGSSLGNADAIKGPAAGPEPYSAPTPKY